MFENALVGFLQRSMKLDGSARTGIVDLIVTDPDSPATDASSFFVHRLTVEPGSVTRLEAAMAQTELALAFQRVTDESSISPLKAQMVFAFLPLRSFGFRFIIQADFITTILPNRK